MPQLSRFLASATAVSLGLGLLPMAGPAAQPVMAADGPIAHVRSDIVLVDASLGGRNDLEGATVEALDKNGKVLQSIVSGNRGEAILSRAEIRGAVKLRVTGGTSEWGTPNNATLYGPVHLDRRFISVVHVTPVTTLAENVSQHRGITFGKGLRAVRTHLEIPHWTAIRHHANNPAMFGPVAFGKFVDNKGGVRQALRALEREMDTGAKHRPLRDRARSGRSLEEFAGEFLFETLFEAISGQSPGELLGSLFGTESPTMQALEQIEKQLEQISMQLNEIQAEIRALENEIKTAEYYTIKTELSDVVSATEKQWDVYNTVVSTVDSTEYGEYAEDFYYALTTTSSEYSNLFTDASGKGLLQALYDMYLSQYSWWNQDDIAKIQSVVDFYGLMQAETTTLLIESWQYSGTGYTHTKTPTYVKTQLDTYYQPQHDKIYASMPDSIGATQIVNPANQRAYTLAPYTPPLGKVGEKLFSNDKSCSSDHYNGTKVPTVTSATVAGWWTSATPAGSTSANNTELAFLKNTRSVVTNGTSKTTNALAIVAPAAPDAWVAVSNQALPYVMWGRNSGYTVTDWLSGWAYCGNTSVSLVSNQIQNFAMGKVMGTADQFGLTYNAYVPSGQKTSFGSMVPVGLLVYTPGNWRYKTS